LESDVRVTVDGVPVLVHDAETGRRPRRAPIDRLGRAELPGHVPSLSDLYEQCGTAYNLSLDVKASAAAAPTIAVAREADALSRLWLCGPLDALAGWRRLDRAVRLVDSTRARHVREGLTDRARTLRSLGAQALNLPLRDWTPEAVARVQREGVLAFAWDAHTPAAVRRAAALGVDAVYGDDVRALLAGAARTA